MILAHKLHRFVVNPSIPPKYASEADRALDKVTEEYEKWLVQDQMLFTWLLSSLSDSILPRTIGYKHAFQVWDTIHKHFQSHMKAKDRQLRSELRNSKKGSRSVSEYLLSIKSIVDALTAIGDPISTQDHLDVILEGLPEDFNPCVMLIYGRLDTPSISDVESLLLMQEIQIEKFKQDQSAGSISVNVAQGPRSQFNNNQGRGGRNRGSRNRGGRGSGGPKPTCQICFKYGHNAFDY